AYLMSLSVDGALSETEREQLDAFLAGHPEAAAELRRLRELKHFLGAKRKAAPDPYFWTRFTERLKQKEEEDRNLLPFPRKYVPVASTLGILAFVALGITIFVQREPLLQYLTDQSAVVQKAYESSILKGSVMPLFADIGNDDVLQYALFGTLPLDKESETALRVDEGGPDGYRIEVGPTAEQRAPKVTVRELIEEVRPSVVQIEQIDSVLRDAGRRIELAGFYAENNALALDPEITRLNRVVLSNIAAVLAPVQRKRFDRFLEERNASYVIAAGHAPSVRSPALPTLPKTVSGRQRDFIVLTPDSFVVTELGLDLDSIMKGPWAVNIRKSMPDMQMKLEHFVRAQAERRTAHPYAVNPEPRVRVVGEEDMIRIEFDSQIVGHEPEGMRVVVEPRGRRNQFFRFEFRTVPGKVEMELPGEVMFEMKNEMDSMVRRIQAQQEVHIRNAMRMDSLARERMKSRKSQGVRVDSLE
ncbi:MAG TPA: hypothetical protein VGA55_09310, partial [Bacteroidota bacterium]